MLPTVFCEGWRILEFISPRGVFPQHQLVLIYFVVVVGVGHGVHDGVHFFVKLGWPIFYVWVGFIFFLRKAGWAAFLYLNWSWGN